MSAAKSLICLGSDSDCLFGSDSTLNQVLNLLVMLA